ncbi:hypothetical protein [Phormidesmis priestleyi]|uniref:hypothetical protein n=1 Tax=Phormidesmis priestleyi TaxID=268141 RepID=UPI000933F449|nr:hypothetical protein [Phormidesmis priestleyi]
MKKLLTIGLSIIWSLGSSIATSHALSAKPVSVKRRICPAEVEPLVALMLRDLPSYANRVIVRSRTRYPAISSLNSIITAGRPEFVPLPLAPSIASTIPSPQNSPDLRQVFMTTLERQGTAGTTIELQQFHWLFLTKTDRGWRLALMFTRTGSASAGQIITPPRESSQGTIGQAVQTWLRDCNAGSVRS